MAAGSPSGQANQKWLGFIPYHVGPPCTYANGMKHWLVLIISAQLVVAVLSLVLAGNILTPIWMGLTAVVGLYAYHQQMNITYICLWGVLSLFNALSGLVSSVFALITGILGMDVSSVVIEASVPAVYLLAAALAWHLLNKYYDNPGRKAYYDPLAADFDRYDPGKNSSVDKYADEAGNKVFGRGNYGSSGPEFPRRKTECC
mmetsp:Transcript_49537/g.80335  ORF Transcript_49537/g.80335 Transcript_49537/m.80335 type:complete len:202 (+) Transcript_49537:2-607(+)